jgi:hypothetical protein
MGFHLMLAVQKYCQDEQRNKGNTVFVFDNHERDRMRFTDLIKRPPDWSDGYYRKPKQRRFDQVIDVPYFGDSKDVALIQLADFLAFILRRYAEIHEGVDGPRYGGEDEKIDAWISILKESEIPSRHLYKKVGREYAENLFYDHAPPCIRAL